MDGGMGIIAVGYNVLAQGIKLASNRVSQELAIQFGRQKRSAGLGHSVKEFDACVKRVGPHSLVSAAATAAATNTYFDAGPILADNQKNAVLDTAMTVESSPMIREGEVINLSLLEHMYLLDMMLEPKLAAEKTAQDARNTVVEEKVLAMPLRDVAQEQLLFQMMLGISEPSRNGYEASVSPVLKEDLLVEASGSDPSHEKEESYFDLIQEHVFGVEGGISNHKNDHGGLTNKGITWKTFQEFAKKDLGIEPILENLKKITSEQAMIIYKKRFWGVLSMDDIHSYSIAHTLYDFYVNTPRNAVRMMQESVNALNGQLVVDNIMGPKTLEAINHSDAHQLFNLFQEKRINFYKNQVIRDPTQAVHLNGWLNRVSSIKFET